MQAVFIKPTSWHYKLQVAVYGKVPYRYHFCPYFWLVIAAMFFFPFILAFRGLKAGGSFLLNLLVGALSIPAEGIANGLDKVVETRKVVIREKRQDRINDFIEKNLTDHFAAFRFYHFYVNRHNFDAPVCDERIEYNKEVWEAFKKTDLYKNAPFALESYCSSAACMSARDRAFHDFAGDNFPEPTNIDKAPVDVKGVIKERVSVFESWKKSLEEENETRWVQPALEARILAREKRAEERRRRIERERKREEIFSNLAQYTRYPFYCVVGITGFALALVAIYGLYLLGGLAFANPGVTLSLFKWIVIGAVAFFVVVCNIAALQEDADDWKWEKAPALARIAGFPSRLLFKTLMPNFLSQHLGPALESFCGWFARVFGPPAAAAGQALSRAGAKIVGGFEIFGHFLKSTYEGSCPNMVIDGDDVNDNHRLGE